MEDGPGPTDEEVVEIGASIPYDPDGKFSWSDGDIELLPREADDWDLTYEDNGATILVQDMNGLMQHFMQNGHHELQYDLDLLWESPKAKDMPVGLVHELLSAGVVSGLPAEALPTFEALFRSDDLPRDNFRSRLFGMFSEDIVRIWASNERAPYRYLGRPTLGTPPTRFTLDFLLQRGPDGPSFVCEQKAELAFEGHRYLRLTRSERPPDQIAHHLGGAAFRWFLDMARDPTSHEVRVDAKPVQVHGAILVWGAVTPEGRTWAMETYGFSDVLALEDMLRDLHDWQDPTWRRRVELLRTWSDGLFAGLL